MKRKINICRICLRLDRKLNPVDNVLLELHDELCEYSDYTLNPLYCWECEHLLRKTYNFKNKCIKAMKIFNNWKKSKENEKKADNLYTLVPISLGFWLHDGHIASLCYEFNDDQHTSTMSDSSNMECFHNNIFLKNTIKLETECESDQKDHIKIKDEPTKINKIDAPEIDIEIVEITNDGSLKKEFDTHGLVDTNAKNDNKIRQNDNDEFNVTLDDFHANDDDESDDNITLTVLSMKKKIIDRNCPKKTKDIVKKIVNAKQMPNVNKKSEKSSKKKKHKLVQFSKERLRLELEAKFEAWGELRFEDGTIIDKDVILNCIDDKITDDRMRQLWNSIQCDMPEPATIRTFKHLIRLFRNEEYASVFNIEYLNTEQKMLEELQRRKTYECYKKAKYKCDKCHLVFNKPKHLENHVNMHEVTAGDLICKICNIRYASIKNYRGHKLAHSAVYRCKLCPLVTYYRDSMVNHYNQHQGKAYSCDECAFIAKSLSGYKRHQYLAHRRGRHVCTACGRAFVSSLGMALHKKKTHQNEAPPQYGATSVTCAECELSFPSEEVFLKHKRTWHQAHKNDKTAKYKRVRKAKPVAPNITCRVCGANGSIGWLSLHFRTEHPTLQLDSVYADKRKHLCHVCAKGFWNASSLRYHLNMHTGHRPYACDLCPKRFFSSIALNEHKLRHFPPTKECNQCGKKFRTHSNLHNHMLFHTGTRRHKCNICGKAFLHSTSLNEHVRCVHYNLRRVRRGKTAREKSSDLASSGEDMSD